MKKRKIECVNCHSLSTLPLGFLFKLLSHSQLVYDTHELESEVIGSTGLRKKCEKLLEKHLIHFADIVILTNDSIAEWYKDQYNLKNIHVVRNVPYRTKNQTAYSNLLKERFKIQKDETLYIFQGSFSYGRSIELLLNAFSQIDKNNHIVFMGYGTLENLIKNYERKFSNIHYHPAVKPEEIVQYTKSADVGISLTENTCLNHYYSLPNKIFEYLLSGIPIIVSDFPEMRKIVEENNCGWTVPVDKKSLIDLIHRITREELQTKKENSQKCKDRFGWENEEKTMLNAYSF